MSNNITSLPFGMQQSTSMQKTPGTDQYSYKQTSQHSESAAISLQTAEGDTVCLSSSSSFMSIFQTMSSSNQECSMSKSSLSELSCESMTCSVQGDLNEEEQADIKNLVLDLVDIAASFFSGDSQNAIDKALNINEMGSIIGLSASFNQTTTLATQMTSYHPMPTFSEDIRDNFTELYQNALTEQKQPEDYQEELFGRWHQIKNILAEINPPETMTNSKSVDHSSRHASEKMMERMEDFLQKNPRLSPFAEPIASKAIEKAIAKLPNNLPQATTRSLHELQNQFNSDLGAWFKNSDSSSEALIAT